MKEHFVSKADWVAKYSLAAIDFELYSVSTASCIISRYLSDPTQQF